MASSQSTINERFSEVTQEIFDMAEFYKQVDWKRDDYDPCHAFNVLTCAYFLKQLQR